MRLIDADALKNSIPMAEADGFQNCRNCGCLDEGQIKELIDNAPTVEHPQIVRCKDCKHGSLYCTEDVCGATLIECNHPDLGDTVAIHKLDWYCADGERKWRF